MRATSRLGVLAVWLCCLAARPSRADDSPRAHLEGFRCQELRDAETPPGVPLAALVVCQIDDGADPVSAGSAPSMTRGASASNIDPLLQLLTTLNRSLHDSSPPHHTTAPPPPTP